jgi:hypothetical protein
MATLAAVRPCRPLLTLEGTVEFFNLRMELQLTEREKAELVAFLRAL